MVTIPSDLSSVFLLARLVISVTSIASIYCLAFIYFFHHVGTTSGFKVTLNVSEKIILVKQKNVYM